MLPLRIVLTALALASASSSETSAAALEVRVVNASEPTLCAEKDNVHLTLHHPDVRRFRVETVHPSYIGTVVADRWAPDFTNCEFDAQGPEFAFQPVRETVHETVDWQLVGYRFPSFWRPQLIPLRIGDQRHDGFHMLQLWTRADERAEEVLVVYPGDGYWRARPLPPTHLSWSAYGSSFLVGPVEIVSRPIVDLRELAFDPDSRTFTMTFERGGTGTLRLATLDRERIVVEIALDRPEADERPFAALRSMYVTETNADVARVAWRSNGVQAWQEAQVMRFTEARTIELWTGRAIASRHNTSAPDTTFTGFAP